MSTEPKKWGDLSDGAQSVLEWAQDIYTERKNILWVKAGDVPLRGSRDIPDLTTPLSEEVAAEIIAYATASEELTVVEHDGGFRVGFHELFEDTLDPSSPSI